MEHVSSDTAVTVAGAQVQASLRRERENMKKCRQGRMEKKKRRVMAATKINSGTTVAEEEEGGRSSRRDMQHNTATRP